jgi:hypothetical protein
VAFESEIWLVVLEQVPEPEQIRAFWNANANNVLDLVRTQDRLWLGRTRAVTPEEPRSPGRAGRVFDLIYLHATTPEYTAPMITEGLVREVMDAFVREDDSGLPATEAGALEAFLTDHLGKQVVTCG